MLAFGLDKKRVVRLEKEERTFQCFYQLLAGATKEEQSELRLLNELSEYTLLASSGYFQSLSSSSGSGGNNHHEDAMGLKELRIAMKVLGFKPRHVSSLFRLLSAILLLGNLEFEDRGERDLNSESAWVVNRYVLESAAELLGIEADDLERGLTNKIRWVRKEMCDIILKAEGAAQQRDSLVQSLYSILFAFVVETANHKLFPGEEAIAKLQAAGGSSILQFNVPGFTTRVPDRPGSGVGAVLVRALNGFEEFIINYSNESVHFWLNERLFDGDSGMPAKAQEDGVKLPDILPPDGSARLELLRGGRIGGKADRKPGGLIGGMSKTCSSVRKGATTVEADEELLRGMRDHFGDQTAFIANPGGPNRGSAFGISHFGGVVAYDASGFIERDLDALDPEFVALFRSSDDGFISKLFSGPSLATETHPLDSNIIVSAQVSNQPLRRPSPIKISPSTADSNVDFTLPLLNPLELHPLTSQLNATLSQLLNLIDRTSIWTVISMRINDTGNIGMIDSKRLKSQIVAYLLPELISRKQFDFITDLDYDVFVSRHGVEGFGAEAVRVFLSSFGLREKSEYALGTSRVWLSYRAWKVIEDRLRSAEPPEREEESSSANRAILVVEEAVREGGEEMTRSGSRSTLGMWNGTEYNNGGGTGGEGASVDDLLMQGENQQSSRYYNNDSPIPVATPHPSSPYATQARYSASLASPTPYIHPSTQQSEVWGSDKPTPAGFNSPKLPHSKEGILDAQGRPIQNGIGATVEVVPTSTGRMIWVVIVWALTWWIPSFCLTHLGRMKRPDVRMAWREKVSPFFSTFSNSDSNLGC